LGTSEILFLRRHYPVQVLRVSVYSRQVVRVTDLRPNRQMTPGHPCDVSYDTANYGARCSSIPEPHHELRRTLVKLPYSGPAFRFHVGRCPE
jgi:hypothetical protein